MSKYSERNEALFGITLTELAFLLFFMIVFISAAKLSTNEDVINNSITEISTLEEQLRKKEVELEDAINQLSLHRDKLTSLLGSGGLMSEEMLQEEISSLIKAEEERNKLEKELEEVRSHLEDVEIDAEKYTDLKIKINKNGGDIDPFSYIETLQLEVNEQSNKNESLLGQYKNLQNKFVGNGLDHPPCWADPRTGKPAYLFELRIQKNSLDIRPAWEKYREGTIDYFDVALFQNAREITVEDFVALSAPILKWSKAQTPECRHFVKVRDSKDTTKEEYKYKLGVIERYFYKLRLGK